MLFGAYHNFKICEEEMSAVKMMTSSMLKNDSTLMRVEKRESTWLIMRICAFPIPATSSVYISIDVAGMGNRTVLYHQTPN